MSTCIGKMLPQQYPSKPAMVVRQCIIYILGNRQKKAKAMIEASGLKMIAVEDFDLAARTVPSFSLDIACYIQYIGGVRGNIKMLMCWLLQGLLEVRIILQLYIM